MTQKDYILLASVIRNVYNETDCKETIIDLTTKLATALKTDNFRFDREKFLKASIG